MPSALLQGDMESSRGVQLPLTGAQEHVQLQDKLVVTGDYCCCCCGRCELAAADEGT